METKQKFSITIQILFYKTIHLFLKHPNKKLFLKKVASQSLSGGFQNNYFFLSLFLKRFTPPNTFWKDFPHSCLRLCAYVLYIVCNIGQNTIVLVMLQAWLLTLLRLHWSAVLCWPIVALLHSLSRLIIRFKWHQRPSSALLLYCSGVYFALPPL